MQSVILLLEQALAILRGLVASDSKPDPDEHSRPPVSSRKVKLAAIVGHNDVKKGAFSKWIGSEYPFNKGIAEKHILAEASNTSVEVKVFLRRNNDYFSAEMRDLVARVNAWNPDCAVSLHFNGFDTPVANGTETLRTNSQGSRLLADYAQACMLDCFGLNNRGAKFVSKNGRGGRFLYGVKAPAVLLEPGFGTNQKDSRSMAANWPRFAKDLIWLVRAWHDEMQDNKAA